VIISDEYKFVFVHIPKTGGTSIKKALHMYYNKDQVEFDGEKVTDIDGYRPHVTLTETDIAKFRCYFKFGVVRNPWSWHASIWSFFQRPDRNNKFITGLPFETYVDSVCDKNCKLPYARNQVEWLMLDGVEVVDFIGRYEFLLRDFELIISQVGLRDAAIQLPHFKKAKTYDYELMYSSRMRKLIEKKHRKDIERFSYQFARQI